MSRNVPSIRRNIDGLYIENALGIPIATINEHDITMYHPVTAYELGVVNLVASNYDLFYENAIQAEED